ncbi:hypothetical protein GCM10028775_47410 [Catellatospora paridis]
MSDDPLLTSEIPGAPDLVLSDLDKASVDGGVQPPSQVRYQAALQPVAVLISHRGSPYSVAHSDPGHAHGPRVRFMPVLLGDFAHFVYSILGT